MTITQKKMAALDAAKALIQKARSEGRDFSAAERKEIEGHHDEIQRLVELEAKALADADLMAPFNVVYKSGEGSSLADGISDRALSFKGVADRILSRESSPVGIKSLLAAGTQAVPTSNIGLIVLADRPAESVLDAVPAETVAENFSYLRQTVRTNNAAPVAVGAQKPTSLFQLTRVEKRLKVVAHISEPIPEYWLKDSTALRQFVQSEMLSGLAEAVTGQFLLGDGVGENLEGITLASGIQTQAWNTDKITTAAYAASKLETLGMVPGFYVLNPTDWVSIQTARATSDGAFLMSPGGAPVDSVKRQLWGTPVTLSGDATAGTGYLVGRGASELFHDGQIDVAWGYASGGFERNQIVCRTEGRFEAGAIGPSGIVEMDLTA